MDSLLNHTTFPTKCSQLHGVQTEDETVRPHSLAPSQLITSGLWSYGLDHNPNVWVHVTTYLNLWGIIYI